MILDEYDYRRLIETTTKNVLCAIKLLYSKNSRISLEIFQFYFYYIYNIFVSVCFWSNNDKWKHLKIYVFVCCVYIENKLIKGII